MFCVICGAANLDIGRFCKVCGQPLVRDAEVGESGLEQSSLVDPPSVLTLAPVNLESPLNPIEERKQAFRDGNKLVVPLGALLPSYCIKCGRTETTMADETFSWLNRWYYLLLFLGLGILLVFFIFRKKASIFVPLCVRHRQYVRRMKIATTVLLVGFIPVGMLVGFLIGEPDGVGWGALIATIMLVSGAITLHLQSPLRAIHINRDRVIIEGASEAFLSKLSNVNAIAATSGE